MPGPPGLAYPAGMQGAGTWGRLGAWRAAAALWVGLAATALWAGGAAAAPWALDAKAEDCPAFLGGVITGTPTAPDLLELSGLAASRRQPGVLWSHNDSGDSNRIFALRPDGALLATYFLDGAVNVDWEDIAIGPGPVPGVDYLYIADVGNNNPPLRLVLTIYRVPEPAVDLGQTGVVETLAGVDALQVMYPNVFVTNHDCETLWSDPVNGDLYLVTKDTLANQDGGISFVYRYPAPHAPGPPTSLEFITGIDTGFGLFNLSTGGDLGPGDTGPLLRTYNTVRHWPRAPGQSVADALAAPPCILPLVPDLQGEAIAWDHEGSGYYTTAEGILLGAPQPIRHYARRNLVVAAAGPTVWDVLIGDTVTLAVSASGGGPIGYQWYRGLPGEKAPQPIPGAAAAIHEIADATFSDSGDYFCEVSDDDEVLASPVFHVAVDAGLPLRGAAAIAVMAMLIAFAIRPRADRA